MTNPVITAIGTAAVVHRRPTSPVSTHCDTILGGSGLLLCAAASALGLSARLAAHLGDDDGSRRIRCWARHMGVEVVKDSTVGASVWLDEQLADGEGAVISGSGDPGPPDTAVEAAMAGADILVIGHTSDHTLGLVVRRVLARLHVPHHRQALLVADLSAAWIHSWPIARLLWRTADVVTIGRSELDQLGLSVRTAAELLKPGAILTVTAGGAGPVAVCAGQERYTVDVKPLPDIVDTMGAGDAFAVTFSTWLHFGAPPWSAARRAVQAAQRQCRVDNAATIQPGAWSDLAPKRGPP